jgi:large subunit ribosomal protein L6
MSRIANQPITIPTGVAVSVKGRLINVKGPKGDLTLTCDPFVTVIAEENEVKVSSKPNVKVRRDEQPRSRAIAGTTRALVNNMVIGVSNGFEKKLLLIGVGYRAAVQGKLLNLTLGFSHPVNHPIPQGITIETPDQTTIIVKGVDKQMVGQVSADIRRYRPPEPYKGKGVRYSDEHVKRKETKKK